jgi:hypothetical protein
LRESFSILVLCVAKLRWPLAHRRIVSARWQSGMGGGTMDHMSSDPLDFLNEPQRPQPPPLPLGFRRSEPRPPFGQRGATPRAEGWTILEYAVGAAAGFIAGIFLAWMFFALAFNLPGGFILVYLCYLAIPGLPIAVVVGMYMVGRRRF